MEVQERQKLYLYETRDIFTGSGWVALWSVPLQRTRPVNKRNSTERVDRWKKRLRQSAILIIECARIILYIKGDFPGNWYIFYCWSRGVALRRKSRIHTFIESTSWRVCGEFFLILLEQFLVILSQSFNVIDIFHRGIRSVTGNFPCGVRKHTRKCLVVALCNPTNVRVSFSIEASLQLELHG